MKFKNLISRKEFLHVVLPKCVSSLSDGTPHVMLPAIPCANTNRAYGDNRRPGQNLNQQSALRSAVRLQLSRRKCGRPARVKFAIPSSTARVTPLK